MHTPTHTHTHKHTHTHTHITVKARCSFYNEDGIADPKMAGTKVAVKEPRKAPATSSAVFAAPVKKDIPVRGVAAPLRLLI